MYLRLDFIQAFKPYIPCFYRTLKTIFRKNTNLIWPKFRLFPYRPHTQVTKPYYRVRASIEYYMLLVHYRFEKTEANIKGESERFSLPQKNFIHNDYILFSFFALTRSSLKLIANFVSKKIFLTKLTFATQTICFKRIQIAKDKNK